jgi:ATP-dependent Clp protease ATP-binding subunit ClpC
MNFFDEAKDRIVKWKLREQAVLEFWDAFTPGAVQVIETAKKQAKEKKKNFFGAEHLLLGLVYVPGSAARLLRKLGLDSATVESEIAKMDGTLPIEDPLDYIPLTPRMKNILENTKKESIALGQKYIGTEHLLLALLSETGGIPYRIFKEKNVDPQKVRQKVLDIVTTPNPPPPDGEKKKT